MKSYLEAIITKARNQEEIVQPRTSSIFEPSAARTPEANWFDASAGTISPVEDSVSLKNPLLEIPKRGETLVSDDGAMRSDPQAVVSTLSGETIEVESAGRHTLSSGPSFDLRSSPVLETMTLESEEIGIDDWHTAKPMQQARQPEVTSTIHTQPGRISPRLPDQVSSGEQRLIAPDEKKTLVIPPSTNDLPDSESSVHGSPTSLSNPLVRTRLEPRAVPAPPMIASGENEEEPLQQVRVTIGRVEVRAVFPSHPDTRRPAKKHTAPRLTLDEYLGRRAKRDR